MEDTQTVFLISIFSELEDPRIDRTKRHSLTDIIAIAICAVVRGADSWVDVELFGKSRQEWLSGFLELPNSIPSHDTFGRVFSLLDAERFQSCFVQWVRSVSEITEGQIVAIDGKTVRRSHDARAGRSGKLVGEIRQHDRTLGISCRLAAFQNLILQLRDTRSIKNHRVGLELDPYANQVAGRRSRSAVLRAGHNPSSSGGCPRPDTLRRY